MKEFNQKDYYNYLGYFYESDKKVLNYKIDMYLLSKILDDDVETTFYDRVLKDWNKITRYQETTEDDLNAVHFFINQKVAKVLCVIAYKNKNFLKDLEQKEKLLIYLRNLWLYIYLYKNKETTVDDFYKIIDEVLSKEYECNYSNKSNNTFYNYSRKVVNNYSIDKIIDAFDESIINKMIDNFNYVINFFLEDEFYEELPFIYKFNYKEEEIVEEVVLNEIDKLKNDQTFTESINQQTVFKLIEEKKLLENEIKVLKIENQETRRNTLEILFQDLNNDLNNNIIDNLFMIAKNKNIEPKTIINIAISFLKVIKSYGYAFTKSNDIGTDVVGVVEELVNHYRWSCDENITDKKMVITKPGLVYQKSNRVVYKPKIEIKEDL